MIDAYKRAVAKRIYDLGVEAGNVATEMANREPVEGGDTLQAFADNCKQWGRSSALLDLSASMLEDAWWERIVNGGAET